MSSQMNRNNHKCKWPPSGDKNKIPKNIFQKKMLQNAIKIKPK